MEYGNNQWLDPYWKDVGTERITAATTKLLGYCEVRSELFPNYAVVRYQGKTFCPILLVTDFMNKLNAEVCLRTKDTGYQYPVLPTTFAGIVKGELVIWLEKYPPPSDIPTVKFYNKDYQPEQFK